MTGRFRRTGWLAAAFALLAAPAVQSWAQEPLSSQEAAEQRLIEHAAPIVANAPALSRIWAGYWPEDQAFILYDPDAGALLISPGERPAGFEMIADTGLPPELRARAFLHRGALEPLNRSFVLGYPIGGGRTAILLDVTRFRGGAAFLDVLFHEQFHDFQRRAFTGERSQFVDPLAIRDRVAFAASAQTERRVLAAALAARNAEERTEFLRAYFALRRTREASMPDAAIRAEQDFERHEGTATYTERMAREIISGGREPFDEGLIAELERRPGAEPFVTAWFRWRSYATGAALSRLLSRYDPSGWQRAVEEEGQLDRLLERHLTPEEDAAALAAAARERFGYASLLDALGPQIREAERSEIKSASEFLALAPFRLVIDFEPTADGSLPDLNTSFSTRTIAPLGPGTTALPQATQLSQSTTSLELVIRERPVLLEASRTRATTTILLSRMPRFEGAGELAPGEHRMDRLEIADEGVQLRLSRPVVVTVDGVSVHIRVPPL